MTRAIAKIFFRGLITFIPLFLTVYILVITIRWLDQATTSALNWMRPELVAFPGAGIALTILGLFLLGLLTSSHLTRWTVRLIETPLRTLPVVKDIYGAIRQFSQLFEKKEGGAGTVVRVRHPNFDGSMVGLLMRCNFSDLPNGIADENNVAVYLPMGYQLGGFTVFIPEQWVEQIDMGVESALRHTLMGWAEEKKPSNL